MLTTEEKLGDWCSPVTRIVNHFGFQGGKKQALLTDVALFKKLENKYGSFGFNDIKKILEINKSDVTTLSVAAKVLGFRGEYKVCKPDNVARLSEEEFDICIIRNNGHSSLVKDVRAKYSLKAF